MCGIAAMVMVDGTDVEGTTVRQMAAAIQHRGPDDEGFYLKGSVGFGFRRLAILDLSPAGHQPMVSSDGSLVLIFNGEIFNYVELREQLEGLGHTFLSSGDTEVLLAAYRQWGRDCLPRLNGMWAFLIYDRTRGIIFGSRDRFGVKPLYRHRSERRVLLASEIKSIIATGHCRREANLDMVAKYLTGGSLDLLDRENQTFYNGIEQVPAGTAFEMDLRGRTREWRYWSVADVQPGRIESPPETFAALFEDAVRLRMRSDVPVGVTLSGGLDSTSIISVMAKLMASGEGPTPGASLEAFSYIAPEFDERPYIEDTISSTGAIFNQVFIDPRRLWDGLDELLWFHDEPVHSLNALITFEIYRVAASKGVKVMLSGQGADETIGGYPVFLSSYWHSMLRRGQFHTVWREIHARTKVHGDDPRHLFTRALRHLAQSELRRAPWYRSLVAGRRRREQLADTWFSADIAERRPVPEVGYVDHNLNTALHRAVEVGPLPTYLQIEDRNSMAHSVEARVPFLDYRLVSLAFQLADHWKFRGPWNKYVLREGMRGRIPETVRMRPDKMGFPVPSAEWFRSDFYEPMQDLLASSQMRTRGWYNIPAIRKDIEHHRAGRIDISRDLLKVAQLERWASVGLASAPRPSTSAWAS